MISHSLMFLLDLPSGSVTAVFPPRGKGSVNVTGNFLRQQEIGYYEAELPTGTYARLQELYKRAGLDGPPEELVVPPDTKTLSVGEVKGEDEFDLRPFVLDAVPPKLEPLLDEMRKAVEHMRLGPRYALRGEGTATQPEFPLDKPVSFLVTLRNVGAEKIQTDSPFIARGPDKVTNLRLIIQREAPPNPPREPDSLYVDLGEESVHPPEGEKAPSGGRFTLEPTKALRIVVRKKLHSTPGRYKAALSYSTTQGRHGGMESLEGVLTMDLGTFEVK